MAPTIEPTLESRRKDSLPPNSAVAFFQNWHDLLFLHWACRPDLIQAMLPQGLHIDTYDGYAWLALIPFAMRGIRARFAPPLPSLSQMLELNLRTYVFDDKGRTGVWFFSLDANSKFGVKFARRVFHLNYLYSKISMSKTESDGNLHFEFINRRFGTPHELATEISYSVSSASEHYLTAEPGSIEYFFLERYALYAVNQKRGKLLRGRVSHQPYEFCAATLLNHDQNVFELDNLPPPRRPPDSILYSPGVDVSIYWPTLLR